MRGFEEPASRPGMRGREEANVLNVYLGATTDCSQQCASAVWPGAGARVDVGKGEGGAMGEGSCCLSLTP